MASQNFLHTAEVMKAAMPYIDSKTRITLDFVTKILDLMGSLNAMPGANKMATCGYESETIDVEGLLTGIRPLCENKERDLIDRILNIFNVKRMFEMYNNMMSTMKTMQEFGGFPFGDDESKDDTDTVTGNFMGGNFESIFNNFTNSSEKPNTESDFSSDNQSENNDGGNGSFSQNSAMFDMLKTMIPPEQISTFENLRMLLSTMSYDNSSKPNQSEEHDNA